MVGLGGYRYRYVFKVEDVSGKKICLLHSQVPVFLTGIFFLIKAKCLPLRDQLYQ